MNWLSILKSRKTIQWLSLLLTNLNLKGLFNGKIYTGASKTICVPGLHCYSCPSSMGACPLGALQTVIGSAKYKFSFYVVGLLITMGTVFGRAICGFLCPFGLVQELMHRIPSKKLKLPKAFKMIKYLVLVYFVILVPLLFTNKLGMGDPGFCKYICPSGTLFGAVPLLITNSGLKSALGILFGWKMIVLIVILTTSVLYYRFFCKVLCPLGLIYGWLNKVSILRYKVNDDLCHGCGACAKTCKMDVKPHVETNSIECIRCGECIEVCGVKAISIQGLVKR